MLSTAIASTRTSRTYTRSEDAAALREILGRGYHAVVGNPPYIAVQDRALRDAYRSRYASCHGKYVLPSRSWSGSSSWRV